MNEPMTKQPTCEERVEDHLESRMDDMRLFAKGEEGEGGEDFYEYGLCFDYVEPGSFEDQDEGYWRYQISWGGPSDEFRYFVRPGERGVDVYKIEYWFMDWFDGAKRTLEGDDLKTMKAIWEMGFSDTADAYDYTEVECDV